MPEGNTKNVYGTTYSLIGKISVDTSEAKRIVALLRHGVAKRPGDDPELFGWLIENIPEELQGRAGNTSYAENSLYLALTLYTVGPADVQKVSIASAASKAEIPRSKLVLAETADDVFMMQPPLRGLARLLKSKNSGFSYGMLAEDIYNWQSDKIRTIRKWEREYARKENKNEQEQALS